MPLISNLIAEKRRWRRYKKRTEHLPEPYRIAIDGLERYLLRTGPADGKGASRMMQDLADLFEMAAHAGTSIQELLGDPIAFADDFKGSYGRGARLTKEQKLLRTAMVSAAVSEANSDVVPR
jgi:DNA-binding ferritin-like protein (Dps family)